MEKIRLSKLMSLKNLCSRREADRYIEKGLVFVDGQRVDMLGIKVLPSAKVELHQSAFKKQKEKVTILLNKPPGYVSCQPEKNYRPAVELVTFKNQMRRDSRNFSKNHLFKLAAAGRLDIDSKGLLVFTQDGTIAKKIIGSNSMEKEYKVWVEGDITEEKLKRLSFGLSLDGKKLKPAKIQFIKNRFLRFVLTEGKKRQIRRMCEMVDLKVISLERVRIGKVCLDVPPGKWRYLSLKEEF